MSDASATPPRSVHPGTVLITFMRHAPQNLVVVPTVIGVSRGLGWGLLLAAAIAVMILVFSWLSWRRFTYLIAPDELVIERGVLNHTRRSIPLERIQDVSIEQKTLHRLLGLAVVKVETGGGADDEAKLDSVSMAEAKRLRSALRGLPSVSTSSTSSEVNAEQVEPSLPIIFQMSPTRVFQLGLLSFSLVWIAALFGVWNFVDQFIYIAWDRVGEWAESAEATARDRFSLGAVLLLTVAILAMGVVSGVIHVFFREHGFTLRAGEGRFRRTRGFITRSEVVVAIRRIQLALIRHGPLRRAFGWSGLSFQTLGGSNDPSGRQDMAPLARAPEVAQILVLAGLPPFDSAPLRPVAPAHGVRAMARAVTVPIILIVGVALWFTPLAWGALALVPVLAVVALFQRNRHRYAIVGANLLVSRGVIAQRDWIVPVPNVQVVTVYQTLLQRVLGIASVLVDTAGASGLGTPDIVDVHLSDAGELAGELAAGIR